MRKKYYLILVNIFIGNLLGFAQVHPEVIKPSVIDTNIEPYTLVWSQTVIEPNGKERKGINTITDKVVINNDTLIRSLKWEDTSDNTYIKTDVLNASTLQPMSIDIRWNPEYVQHTDISNQTYISTTLKNSISNSELSVNELNESAFSWSSDGFPLLCLIDKKISDSFTLQILQGLPHQPSVAKKEFKFITKEELMINGVGKILSKKIETVNSGNIKTTYWLSNYKPYIVQVMFEQENKQVTIWNIESLK